MKNLSQKYDRLTGDERFQLILAAMARNDEHEACRLVDTCPIRNYRQADADFTNRADLSLLLTSLLALEVAPHLAVIRHLDTQAYFAKACLELAETAGFEAAIAAHWHALDPDGTLDRSRFPDMETLTANTVQVPRQISERLREFWRTLREQHLETVATTWVGFDAFTNAQWGETALDAV